MSSNDKSDKRHGVVARMLPADWDHKPFGLATEVRILDFGEG